jgi:hypothetical protein
MFTSKSNYDVTSKLDFEDRAAVKTAIEGLVRDYEQVRKAYVTLSRAVNSTPAYD